MFDLLYIRTGILSSAVDSLFYYRGATSWTDFHDPAFVPTFTPTFTDPALETQAMSLCAGDQACLYDVAVTGRLDIGMTTRGGSEELAMFAALAVPGVCVHTFKYFYISIHVRIHSHHSCRYIQYMYVCAHMMLYKLMHACWVNYICDMFTYMGGNVCTWLYV